MIESGSFIVAVAQATTTGGTFLDVGLPVRPTAPPATGGTAGIQTTAKTPFAAGTLSFKLRPGQRLPIGDVRFPLTAVSPIAQGAVSLLVDIARQFADRVITEKITSVHEQASKDLTVSDNALALLIQLANDLRNTASLTAQRIALERLDTMIAERAIHTAYDLKTAERQREDIESTVQALVEDTVKEWTEGGGWCNVNNPNVVQMWLDRWRTDR